MEKSKEELAKELAQAALRAWFGDHLGFRNMDLPTNKRAVKAVLAILNQ